MRRGVESFTTARAAVTACALCLALIALSALLSALPVLSLAVLTAAAAPALLMIAGLTAGLWPMAFCLAAVIAALGVTGGPAVAGCAALYLLPVTAVFTVCLRRRIAFWKSCGALAASLFFAQLALLLTLRLLAGGELFLTAGRLTAQIINEFPYRDNLLYSLVSVGLLTVPAAMRETAIVATLHGYALSEEVVNELLLQVRENVRLLCGSLTPALLISGSGLNALIGLSLGIRWGSRAAQKRAFLGRTETVDFPTLDMPPLRAWHLPRPWGLRIGVLALGYLLARSDHDALSMLGALAFQTFALCFSVQGLAALNFSQHKRGTAKGWRVAAVIAALLLRFMQLILIVLGVMDQITNARELRPPVRPRGEEEQ